MAPSSIPTTPTIHLLNTPYCAVPEDALDWLIVWFKASTDEGAAELEDDRTKDPVGAAQMD